MADALSPRESRQVARRDEHQDLAARYERRRIANGNELVRHSIEDLEEMSVQTVQAQRVIGIIVSANIKDLGQLAVPGGLDVMAAFDRAAMNIIQSFGGHARDIICEAM
jgi:hypothetical protein